MEQTQDNQVQESENIQHEKPHKKEEDHKHPDEPNKGSMMRAAVIEEFGKPAMVMEVPIPVPKSGEVLIKVEAAPINPVDLEFLRGMSIHKPPFPTKLGYEGSGTVIGYGGGLMARSYVGKRVAFGSAARNPGTWAQYAVTDVNYCLVLEKDVPFEIGACGIINPLTALAFVEIAKKDKHAAVVQTAAASQLGRMLIKLFKKEGIKTINVVRKPEQKKMLEELGADVVIVSEPGFEADLKKAAHELNATLCLECICGEITHKVIKALPINAVCYIYGHLSKEELTDLNFNDILKNNKTIIPFTFKNWFKDQGFFGKIGTAKKAQKLLMSDLKSEISKTFTLDQINEAIQYYTENMSAGKVIIKSN